MPHSPGAGASGLSVFGKMTNTAGMIWRHPENRGRRARRVTRWLAWQLWERAVGSPRVIEMHGGVRLVCRPHDHVTSLALYCGLYDSEEMRFLLAWLRRGDTFVDIGANVAPYSLLSTLVPDVSAVAFEPGSLALDRARANIRLNGAEQRVSLVPSAVSDVEGVAWLTADRWAKNALVDGSYDGELEKVDATTLDRYVHEHGVEGVSLMKIDVEGHEPGVLRGARAVIDEHRPALIVECNDVSALAAFARRHGYSLVRYTPRSARLEVVDWAAGPGGNVILVPDVGRARERVAQAAGVVANR